MEKSKKTVSKCSALILVISVLALCFSGCSNEKTGFTYKFVVLEKADEVKTEDLGELRTDGDFHKVNPNNMLKYLGYYSGLDFVTLVFDQSSQMDTAKYSREFGFPYKASEPMSFYQVCILPFRGISDVEYDACVCKAVQKAVINQSGYGFNWTDYKYDLELQYYFADSDKWETATKKDMKTDHAPRL